MSLFSAEGPVELIGHTDKYFASCLTCADLGVFPGSLSNSSGSENEIDEELLEKIEKLSMIPSKIKRRYHAESMGVDPELVDKIIEMHKTQHSH